MIGNILLSSFVLTPICVQTDCSVPYQSYLSSPTNLWCKLSLTTCKTIAPIEAGYLSRSEFFGGT